MRFLHKTLVVDRASYICLAFVFQLTAPRCMASAGNEQSYMHAARLFSKSTTIYHLFAKVTMASAQDVKVMRRLRCKTTPQTAQHPQMTTKDPVIIEMMAADGVVALPGDARRQNMHYVHCRTYGKDDVQPHQLTRKGMWQHMLRCYAEAYPDASNETTQSIVSFGIVVKEKHKDALKEEDRSEHHHVIMFCTEKHYWRKIRNISAEKYGIQLNAVAHDGYAVMYRYVRCHSSNKPPHEIDAQPFFSEGHPQGDALQNLLAIGEASRKARAAKLALSSPLSPPEVKTVFGAAFNWVSVADTVNRRTASLFQVVYFTTSPQTTKSLSGPSNALDLSTSRGEEVNHRTALLMLTVRRCRPPWLLITSCAVTLEQCVCKLTPQRIFKQVAHVSWNLYVSIALTWRINWSLCGSLWKHLNGCSGARRLVEISCWRRHREC